ncbi:SLOG family protein [Syntrophomonas erecta]
MALAVEQWAAEAVLELKRTCPDLSLECALPYETQD